MSGLITTVRGDAQPKAIIVLDCELSQVSDGAHGQHRRDRVDMIRSIYWDHTIPRGQPLGGVQTDEVHRWWAWLQSVMPRRKVTYIVGLGMYRMMTALGMWEQMQRGDWSITQADGTHAIAADGSKPTPWRGYCVTADPPTIVLAQCGQYGPVAKWLDVANWGLRQADLPTNPHDRTQAIVRWTLDTVRWLDAHKLGGLQDTSGAQAMYTWRRRFLSHSVVRHDDDAVHDLERRAYYGGRCECGYVGDATEPIYHLDCNSLYPSVCIDRDVPCELIQVDMEPGHNPIVGLPDDVIRIADVEIETDEPAYPWRHDSGTYWPVGRFWTTLAEPELFVAEQMGHVRKYGTTAYYTGAPALSEYMRWLYQQRLASRRNGNTAGAALCKAMLVGLPGKLAQQSRQWVDDTRLRPQHAYSVWYQRDPETHEMMKWRSVAWHVQREVERGHHPGSVPAIAAWITSAGRARLWSLISRCPSRSVIYWDTDSLWCRESAYRALLSMGEVHESAPGRLSMRACHVRVSIYGSKHYTADGIDTCAGVPAGTKVSADGMYRFALPRSFAQQLAAQQTPQPIIDQRVVSARQRYRHGVIGEDGWVRPLKLGGDYDAQNE